MTTWTRTQTGIYELDRGRYSAQAWFEDDGVYGAEIYAAAIGQLISTRFGPSLAEVQAWAEDAIAELAGR